ncbi:MAG: hypothetical protein F2667_11650 [Actinobacteria bacterium]|uniref:Unannotated protein n=1 Tax=freshwater metagenome TaxID=449393 RepID=A0A6J6RQT1_9ZZZZ|nr:hypothetical protein [Actinomycetota bacterium]
MHLRRSFALAAGTLALAASALTSCGFDYATDRPYTPAAGVNDRSGVVDVLGATIVASQADAGTFVATLSNNSADKAVALTSVSAVEGTPLTASTFEPITIKPLGLVNLADLGIGVAGDFSAGQFLSIELRFDNGETAAIELPVVTNCGMFAGFDTATAPDYVPAEGVEAADPAAEPTPYSCEPAEPVDHEE